MHKPVLLQEVVEGLNTRINDVYVDATIGWGGHASTICPLLGEDGLLVGFDRDPRAIEAAQRALLNCSAQKKFINDSYANMTHQLLNFGVTRIDKVLFDLGFSSAQVDDPERGFSFTHSGPLDMRYDTDQALTAKEIVNTWEEENIAQVLYGFGGERFSRRIARAITRRRAVKPIETTSELASIIVHSVPRWYRVRKAHPATKTFQALRIAVNRELEELKTGLESAWEHLTPKGRIAVISFHSLEDRVVKLFFRNRADSGEGELITRKPIAATPSEVERNPRSRSAKLRIIEKLS